jgi:BirA family biotin operon repressor/biotin-[acetyl-CoA-carboxylase] ligase
MYVMFDAEAIRAATFVRRIELHDTLGSTNDRAVELARKINIELPALVLARHQTAGRGRGRNRWWSADGALTFSLLLDRTSAGVPPAKWPQLSLATAVAVCDALSPELSAADNPQSEFRNPKSEWRLGIKWPNDVLLDGGKVCGILIESPGGAAPAKDRFSLGVGINVNNSWRTAPRDFGPTGAALSDVTRRHHDLQAILIRVLQALPHRIGQLASGDSRLPDAWQNLSWLTGQGVDVNANGRWVSGVCVGIDEDGALLVKNVTGIHQLRDGSVRVV